MFFTQERDTMDKKPEKKEVVRYEADAQRKAAERVLLQKEPLTQVAKDMGCSTQSVTKWVKKFRGDVLGTGITSEGAPKKRTAKKTKKTVKKKTVPSTPQNAKPAVAKSDTLSDIELVSKGGTVLRLPAGTSPDTLASVIKRLDESE